MSIFVLLCSLLLAICSFFSIKSAYTMKKTHIIPKHFNTSFYDIDTIPSTDRIIFINFLAKYYLAFGLLALIGSIAILIDNILFPLGNLLIFFQLFYLASIFIGTFKIVSKASKIQEKYKVHH